MAALRAASGKALRWHGDGRAAGRGVWWEGRALLGPGHGQASAGSRLLRQEQALTCWMGAPPSSSQALLGSPRSGWGPTPSASHPGAPPYGPPGPPCCAGKGSPEGCPHPNIVLHASWGPPPGPKEAGVSPVDGPAQVLGALLSGRCGGAGTEEPGGPQTCSPDSWLGGGEAAWLVLV